jgi:hypothetical protein
MLGTRQVVQELQGLEDTKETLVHRLKHSRHRRQDQVSVTPLHEALDGAVKKVSSCKGL